MNDVLDTTWADAQLGYLLRRAVATMNADLKAHTDDAVRPVLVTMLSVIDANPGVSQSAAGDALGIKRPNVATLVAELTDAGLVARTASPDDARRHELRLTPAGRAALTAGQQAIASHEARVMSNLSTSESDTLLRLLRTVVV